MGILEQIATGNCFNFWTCFELCTNFHFKCLCRLATQKEQFLKKKESLSKEIHTKKEFLDSLQPRLENILKVSCSEAVL